FSRCEEITNLDQIRLDMMKNTGLTTIVVSSSEGIENVDKESAVKYARLTNDAVAAAAKKYPGQIIGTITLPTPYVEESIAELERAVNELGLQYWHTHSSYGDERLSDAKFEPLIAKCAELNVPIYLHPVCPSDDYLTDSGVTIATSGFGFSVDTMKTMLKLIISGTFDKYPNLQMILGHMGEYFPYALERMDKRFGTLASGDPTIKCKENISYYFRNGNIFITTSGITDQQVILFAIDSLGIDHIMFATDYPYEAVDVQTDCIKSLPISDEDKDKIFYRNAEKYILKDRS
ncbi:MAG TPA: amidohydrolase family protein, partial [Methanocorpusculum sp.]|nr:amidohydrolase family protein [Methanocorpusculum sp.]